MRVKRMWTMLVAIALIIAIAPESVVAISTEGKVYCTATVEEDFADSRVLLVLSQNASNQTKEYTVADFADYGCIAVTELNAAMAGNGGSFRRILCLELGVRSKENVLTVIDELILREDVIYAGPDYIISAYSTVSNDLF